MEGIIQVGSSEYGTGKEKNMENLHPEPLKIRPGQRLGNYRLIRLLDRGAYANVYLGMHCYLHTEAAVKVLRRRMTNVQRIRFRNEAQIAARLVHPNVVRVLEYGLEQISGTPYLVMDYAQQGSLRQRHPIGARLSYNEIIDYAWQIAAGLDYIHRSGYIHQDVKPENLLIGEHGQILLSDFGIAIEVNQGIYRHESQGTLPYMAPEQIEGQPCAATDQYALAIIIYEWLCGDVPFDGPAEVVMDRHLHAEPPSLQSRVSGVPLAVERVLMQALAKNPGERYASIVDFVHKLDDAWLATASLADEFYQLPTDKLEIPFELVSRQKQGEIEKMQQNKKANFSPPPVKSWMRVCWGFLQTCGIGLALLKGLTFVQWPWASLLSAILLAIWTIFRSVRNRLVLSLMLSILSLALISALIVRDSTGFILVTTVGSGLCALVAATVALQSR